MRHPLPVTLRDAAGGAGGDTPSGPTRTGPQFPEVRVPGVSEEVRGPQRPLPGAGTRDPTHDKVMREKT